MPCDLTHRPYLFATLSVKARKACFRFDKYQFDIGQARAVSYWLKYGLYPEETDPIYDASGIIISTPYLNKLLNTILESLPAPTEIELTSPYLYLDMVLAANRVPKVTFAKAIGLPPFYIEQWIRGSFKRREGDGHQLLLEWTQFFRECEISHFVMVTTRKYLRDCEIHLLKCDEKTLFLFPKKLFSDHSNGLPDHPRFKVPSVKF